jgi:hypothetical protein
VLLFVHLAAKFSTRWTPIRSLIRFSSGLIVPLTRFWDILILMETRFSTGCRCDRFSKKLIDWGLMTG